jgi:hypothetical protein
VLGAARDSNSPAILWHTRSFYGKSLKFIAEEYIPKQTAEA